MDCVCFLPGILGSELRTDDDRRVWPPSWNEALSRLADWKLERLLNEAPLKAPDVIERVCVKNIYGGLFSTIQEAGFSRFSSTKRFVPLPYDWRRDIVTQIAPTVAANLDVLAEMGGTNFRFVAHSMGGLVARVLLQHHDYRDRVWRQKATQLVTIATPFKGAPLAVARLMGIEGTSGIPASEQ